MIPTTHMLAPSDGKTNVDIDKYKEEMTACMSSAWQAARDHIWIAQSEQKRNYDKHKKATSPCLFEGDRVSCTYLLRDLGRPTSSPDPSKDHTE